MNPDKNKELIQLWHKAYTYDGRVKDVIAYHAYHLARYEAEYGKIKTTGWFGSCEPEEKI